MDWLGRCCGEDEVGVIRIMMMMLMIMIRMLRRIMMMILMLMIMRRDCGLVGTMLWRRKPGSRQAGEGSHRPTHNAMQTAMLP